MTTRTRRRPTPAGWAFKHSASQQKHLAHALQVSASTISRMISGELPSAVSQAETLVRTLVREGRTDAGHVIGHLMAVAESEAIELGAAECKRRLLKCLAQETVLQAAEDVAEYELAHALGTDEDLRAKLEAHDQAVCREVGSEIDALIYNRALRVLYGWRVAP